MKETQTQEHKHAQEPTKQRYRDGVLGFRRLFVEELKDIYWSEYELTKAIPKMIENCENNELTKALTDHLAETKKHVERLEKVFVAIGETKGTKICEMISGLIREAEENMEENEMGYVKDSWIISAVQKIEHHEIATYSTLCSFARVLGETEAVKLMNETLEEEKHSDKTLAVITKSLQINISEDGVNGRNHK